MIPSFLLYIPENQDCVFLVGCSPILIGGGYIGAVPTSLPKKINIDDFSMRAKREVLELMEWYRTTRVEDERKIDPKVNEEVKILEKKCADLLVSEQDGDELWVSKKNGENMKFSASISSAELVNALLKFASKK